jgi:hypothetical protein
MILACIREQIHLKEAGILALFIFIVLIGIVATQFVDGTLGIRNLLVRDVSTKAYVLHVLTWLSWGILIGITGCRIEKKRNGLKYWEKFPDKSPARQSPAGHFFYVEKPIRQEPGSCQDFFFSFLPELT